MMTDDELTAIEERINKPIIVNAGDAVYAVPIRALDSLKSDRRALLAEVKRLREQIADAQWEAHWTRG